MTPASLAQVTEAQPGAIPTQARLLLLQQLVEQASRRLQKAQLVFGLMFLAQIVLNQLFPPRHSETLFFCELAGLLWSVAGYLAIRYTPGSKPSWLAEAYLLGLALVISVGEAVHGWSPGEQGVSRLVVVVLLIPVFLPSGVARALAICSAAVATAPLSYLVLPLIGIATPNMTSAVVPLAGDLLAILGALLPALTVSQLNQKALETYELGQYQLIRRLSQGGMGELWLAQHRHLRRPAAIKFVRPSSESGFGPEELLERFQREAAVLSRLCSPHTVRIFDFGQDTSGRLYLVMEYLLGIDLEQLILQYGVQPQGRVVELLIQVCRSLEEAHHLGLVHRDIKPANLFLTHLATVGDFVKVLDFGLVSQLTKEQKQWTSAEILRGTPGYMSPEQISGQPVTPASDIYCLGCVAFWLLTGQAVFTYANPLDGYYAHLHERVPRPSWRTDNEICPPLDLLVQQCLSKNPQDRPSCCRELRLRLMEIQSHNITPNPSPYWWSTAGLNLDRASDFLEATDQTVRRRAPFIVDDSPS